MLTCMTTEVTILEFKRQLMVLTVIVSFRKSSVYSQYCSYDYVRMQKKTGWLSALFTLCWQSCGDLSIPYRKGSFAPGQFMLLTLW